MNLPKKWWNYFICIDVESMGLHGPWFAVGAVIYKNGIEVGEFFGRAKDFSMVDAVTEDVLWVAENVLPHLPDPTHESDHGLRAAFWKLWMKHSKKGAVMVADVAWPVEGHFLNDCVRYGGDKKKCQWKAPYPLIDAASIFAALGEPPKSERLPDELPVHHPVSDARRSARKLLEVLRKHKQQGGWE